MLMMTVDSPKKPNGITHPAKEDAEHEDSDEDKDDEGVAAEAGSGEGGDFIDDFPLKFDRLT